MTKTCLVSGGMGFIGRYTCRELMFRGYDVVSFDRTAQPKSEFPHILGDIRDRNSVNEAVAHSDAVIHLAGILGTQETIQNPSPAAETNILGGLNVLEAATQYGLPMVNIAVGNYWMSNTYSISKSAVERFCHMYREERGLKVGIVRALNAYGPEQSVAAPFGPSKVRKIMPSFICRALTGQPIEVYGDGSQIMDMVYVADVAKVLVDTLERVWAGEVLTEPVEAGTGRRTSVLNIAQAVQTYFTENMERSVPIEYLPMRPGEPDQSVVLAENPYPIEGGYINLENGVERTIKWFASEWYPSYIRQKSILKPSGCYWDPQGNKLHPDTEQCSNHEDF